MKPEEMSVAELEQLLHEKMTAVDAIKEEARAIRSLRDRKKIQAEMKDKVASLNPSERAALAQHLIGDAGGIASGEEVGIPGGRKPLLAVATRFYFAATTAGDVAPSFDAGWEYTSEAVNRKLLNAKDSGQTLANGTQIGAWTAGNDALDRQFVSPPLKGGSISGTVKCYMRCREHANGDNTTSRLGIRVVSGDGTSVTGTLLAVANYGPTTELVNSATLRNKAFADGDTLSAVTANDGDRIVVEIGYSDAAGTTPEGTGRYGSSSASDLGENETDTADNNPWIEFSANLTFLLAPSAIATAEAHGTQKMQGTVAPSAVASAEAHGTQKMQGTVAPSAVASAEAHGSQRLQGKVFPSAVGTGELHGSTTVQEASSAIQPNGIATAEAHGSTTMAGRLLPSALASAEAHGAQRLQGVLSPSAVASLEAHGATRLAGVLSTAGIASLEAHGAARLAGKLLPAAIATLEAHGTTRLVVMLLPGAVASAEAHGTQKILPQLSPVAIATAEAHGTSLLVARLLPVAIASQETIGSATVAGAGLILPAGLTSAEAFGTALLQARLFPQALASGEAHGASRLIGRLFPSAVASAEALGNAVLAAALRPIGIGTAEAVGAIRLGGVLLPSAITSLEAHGATRLRMVLLPAGLGSAEAHGVTVVGFVVQVVHGYVLLVDMATTAALGIDTARDVVTVQERSLAQVTASDTRAQ